MELKAHKTMGIGSYTIQPKYLTVLYAIDTKRSIYCGIEYL